jgi:hypothetical protein
MYHTKIPIHLRNSPLSHFSLLAVRVAQPTSRRRRWSIGVDRRIESAPRGALVGQWNEVEVPHAMQTAESTLLQCGGAIVGGANGKMHEGSAAMQQGRTAPQHPTTILCVHASYMYRPASILYIARCVSSWFFFSLWNMEILVHSLARSAASCMPRTSSYKKTEYDGAPLTLAICSYITVCCYGQDQADLVKSWLLLVTFWIYRNHTCRFICLENISDPKGLLNL